MAHFKKSPEGVCALSSGQGSRGGVDRIQSSGQLCAGAHMGAAVGCRADLGIENSGTIFDGIISTWHTGYWLVAGILAMTSVAFPLIKLFLIFWISLNLKRKRIPGYLPQMMRIYVHADEWGMLEVMMIGILVTIIKMHHMAHIHYDTGFFCFTALMLTALGSSLALDKTEFWRQIEHGRTQG